jgi:hypothetical protein
MTESGDDENRKLGGRAKTGPLRKPRPGLPAPDRIVSKKTFTSPKGRRYRILRTTEMDAYDKRTEPGEKE